MIAELLTALLSLELFIFAILAHEIGHTVAFRYYGIKPKLRFKRAGKGFKMQFNLPESYQALPDFPKLMVYLFGVGFGWNFLFYSYIIFNIPLIFVLFWGAVYIYGCKTDIKNFIKCWKRID